MIAEDEKTLPSVGRYDRLRRALAPPAAEPMPEAAPETHPIKELFGSMLRGPADAFQDLASAIEGWRRTGERAGEAIFNKIAPLPPELAAQDKALSEQEGAAKLEKIHSDVQGFLDKHLPPTSEDFEDQLAHGFFYGGTMLLAGVASGGAEVAPILTAAGEGATLSFGSMYWRAKGAGATDEDAIQAAMLAGAVGTTQAIPMGRFLGRLAGDVATRPIVTALLREGGQAAVQAMGQKYLEGKIANAWYAEPGLYDILRSGAAGGLTGVFLSAATHAAAGKANGKVTVEQPPAEVPGSEQDMPATLARQERLGAAQKTLDIAGDAGPEAAQKQAQAAIEAAQNDILERYDAVKPGGSKHIRDRLMGELDKAAQQAEADIVEFMANEALAQHGLAEPQGPDLAAKAEQIGKEHAQALMDEATARFAEREKIPVGELMGVDALRAQGAKADAGRQGVEAAKKMVAGSQPEPEVTPAMRANEEARLRERVARMEESTARFAERADRPVGQMISSDEPQRPGVAEVSRGVGTRYGEDISRIGIDQGGGPTREAVAQGEAPSAPEPEGTDQNQPAAALSLPASAKGGEGAALTPRLLPEQKDTRPAEIKKWLGDRQEANVNADRISRIQQDELLGSLPKRSLVEKIKETARAGKAMPEQAQNLDKAIFFNVDLRDPSAAGAEERTAGQLKPEDEQTLELSKHLPPEAQKIADDIVAREKAVGDVARDRGLINSEIQSHIRRFWKPLEEGKVSAGQAKFRTSSGTQKRRSFPSVLDGLAAGRELEIPGAIKAHNRGIKELSQLIHDKALLKEGLRAGIFSTSQEEDHQEIEHPNFKVYRPVARAAAGTDYSELSTFGSGRFATPEGTVMERVPVYAPPETAKYLNNVLGQSMLNKYAPVRGLTKFTNMAKHSVFEGSFFHHANVIGAYMLGAQKSNPVEAYRAGANELRAFGPRARELVREGLTLGYQPEYDELRTQDIGKIEKAIDSVPGLKEAKNLLLAGVRAQQAFLWHRLIPQLKLHAALLEYQAQSKKFAAELSSGEKSEGEVAKMAAHQANDLFGGINLQEVGRDPTVQHAARLALLAPDWSEGTLHLVTRALREGDQGAVYRATWGRVIARAAVATVAANLVMSAADDESFVDRYKKAWETGNARWLDVDITPMYHMLGGEEGGRKYLSLLSRFSDPARLVSAALPGGEGVAFLKHKASIVSRMVLDALSGENWRGQTFTTAAELAGVDEKGTLKSGKNKGKPKGGRLAGQTAAYNATPSSGLRLDQVPSFALHEAESVLPIPVESGINFLSGEMNGFDALAAALGMKVSSPKPKKSSTTVPSHY